MLKRCFQELYIICFSISIFRERECEAGPQDGRGRGGQSLVLPTHRSGSVLVVVAGPQDGRGRGGQGGQSLVLPTHRSGSVLVVVAGPQDGRGRGGPSLVLRTHRSGLIPKNIY